MRKTSFFFLSIMLFSIHIASQKSFLRIFNRYELPVKEPINDIIVDDLNEDGLQDLLIITKSSEDKKILVFFQKSSGFFKNPDQVLNIDKEAVSFDLGNITDEHKGKEIVYLTNRSVYYYYMNKNLYLQEPKKVMETISVFQSPTTQSPFLYRFIFDLDGDKADDFLIPEAESMNLFLNDKNGNFVKTQQIKIGSHYEFFQDIKNLRVFYQRIIIQLPIVYFEDFNGDKKDDIISVFEDKIRVFFNKGNGLFSSEPGFKINLKTLTQEEKEKTLAPMLDTYVIDLNNDGFMDFVISKSLFRGVKGTQKIYIFLNRRGNISSRPDQIIVNEDSVGPAQIMDLNGDKQKDLIISEIKLGLFRIIKLLLTRKLGYNLSIYLGKQGLYRESPVQKVKYQIRVVLERTGVRGKEFLEFRGDFNGDGVNDLLKNILIKGKHNWLYIFKGKAKKKKMFYDLADYVIVEEMGINEVIINDLNRDKKSDIVFDIGEKDKKRIVIFLSRKKS